jgi:hypothetical protein
VPADHALPIQQSLSGEKDHESRQLSWLDAGLRNAWAVGVSWSVWGLAGRASSHAMGACGPLIDVLRDGSEQHHWKLALFDRAP